MDLETIIAQGTVNDGGGGGLFLGVGLLLVIVVLGILALVFWIWALIDAIRNPLLGDTERIIWVVVILLTSWLGALIYLAIGRKGNAARPAT